MEHTINGKSELNLIIWQYVLCRFISRSNILLVFMDGHFLLMFSVFAGAAIFACFWRQSFGCHRYFCVSRFCFSYTYLSFQREKRRSRCCHSSPLLIGPVIEATGMRPASRDCCNEKRILEMSLGFMRKILYFFFLKLFCSCVLMCIYKYFKGNCINLILKVFILGWNTN